MKNKTISGFTLVELIVAAIVLALAITSTVTMVRKGQEMIAIDKHRRMARGVIERTLESKDYQPEDYSNLTTITTPTPKDTIIDPKGDIHGNLTVTVGAEQQTINGVVTPYRVITATITWTEPGSAGKDTVRISKWVTNIPAQE
jgi:prepilin-type N-terminal cleavage/methylation domain-containing protein